MNVKVMNAIEITLKDYGIDWILQERDTDFTDLMNELKLALEKVLD